MCVLPHILMNFPLKQRGSLGCWVTPTHTRPSPPSLGSLKCLPSPILQRQISYFILTPSSGSIGPFVIRADTETSAPKKIYRNSTNQNNWFDNKSGPAISSAQCVFMAWLCALMMQILCTCARVTSSRHSHSIGRTEWTWEEDGSASDQWDLWQHSAGGLSLTGKFTMMCQYAVCTSTLCHKDPGGPFQKYSGD